MTATKRQTLREAIVAGTHGNPPDRACLPGSDEKWGGYQLGVEDATHAAEEWMASKSSVRS